MQQYDLHYSAGTNRTGGELMIFSASLAQKISTSGENESLIMSTSPDWKSGVWRNRVSNYLTTALQSYLDTIDSLPSRR